MICPVCDTPGLRSYDICATCGWQDDAAAESHPDKCDGGPNKVPLSIARRRWAAGERDKSKLGACPFPDRKTCEGCPLDPYPEWK